MVESMGPHQELSINDKNITFGLLEAGTCVADMACSFEGNASTTHCLQACFQQSGSEKDRPRSGRPRIATPCENRFISRRYSHVRGKGNFLLPVAICFYIRKFVPRSGDKRVIFGYVRKMDLCKKILIQAYTSLI